MPLTRRDLLGYALPGLAALVAACSRPVGTLATSTTLPSTTLAQTETAEVVYRGGVLLTMNPNLPRADALAIRSDRIVAIGDETSVMAHAGADTTVVDLEGRAILPGFNDAHCHRLGDREMWGFSSAEEAIAETLANGFTSISELFVNEERLEELTVLDEAGKLRLRVNAYLPVNFHEDKFGIWFEHLRPHQQMSPRVRIGGVKAFADRIDPRHTLLSEDHPDQPGYRGLDYWAPGEIADLVGRLHRDGWQVAIHTGGDAAHDMVLAAFEQALEGGPNQARHRIEHLAILRDDQIERMAKLGIVASFQLGWFDTGWDDWGWEESWEDALGDLIHGVGRWRDLLDAGVPAVGSTDCPWSDPPVGPAMAAVADAVTRRGPQSGEPAPWQESQRIMVEEALYLLTARGAWATFEEEDKGSLEVGKLADLVILSEDPTAVPSKSLADVDVLATIIGGQPQYCAQGAESLCVSAAT